MLNPELVKQDKAIELRLNGLPLKESIQRAGLKGNLDNHALAKLRKAREGFMSQYVRYIKKNKYNAKFTVELLKKVADKGMKDNSSSKDDFNALQSAKIHLNLMSRIAFDNVHQTNVGVFIVPQGAVSGWSDKVQEASQVVDNPVNTVDNSLTNVHKSEKPNE